MKENELCGKCDKATRFDKTCYVCDSCKRIVFKGSKTQEECLLEIKTYIDFTKTKLMENIDELHLIEQKVLNKDVLTKEEEKKKCFCDDFRNVLPFVEQLVLGSKIAFSDKSKKILYNLLQVSKKEFWED